MAKKAKGSKEVVKNADELKKLLQEEAAKVAKEKKNSKESKKEGKKESKKETKEEVATKDEKKATGLLYANVVKRTGEDGNKIIFIKNLDDFPKDIKKGLKPYHKAELTEKNQKHLRKAMKALGVTTSEEKGTAPTPKSKSNKQAPPKFVPREFNAEGKHLIELGNNHTPKHGDLYLMHAVEIKGKGDKKREVVTDMLIPLLWAGNNTVYWLDPKTEDAIVGTPEMLKKRQIWNTDEKGKPSSEPVVGKVLIADCIPVKDADAKKDKDEKTA